MKIHVVIPVEPVAKGRPKMTTAGGFARAYTPAKTRHAEWEVASEIRHALEDFEPFPAKTPVTMTVTFYRQRPASLRKSVTMPVSRPDLDNFIKLVLDSIQPWLVPDDSQICDIVARKRYGRPRIELTLETDDETY